MHDCVIGGHSLKLLCLLIIFASDGIRSRVHGLSIVPLGLVGVDGGIQSSPASLMCEAPLLIPLQFLIDLDQLGEGGVAVIALQRELLLILLLPLLILQVVPLRHELLLQSGQSLI